MVQMPFLFYHSLYIMYTYYIQLFWYLLVYYDYYCCYNNNIVTAVERCDFQLVYHLSPVAAAGAHVHATAIHRE